VIRATTKLCCLIGNPVEHSMSPAIHNSAFENKGLDYAYVAFKVEDAAAAVTGIRGFGIRGASVTIPHKLAVMPHLDEIDEIAGHIGAVNTIINEGGRLVGYNTDGLGAYMAIVNSGFDPTGCRVAAIGSGGAARAVLFTLLTKGQPARLDLFGVVPEELKKLGKELAALGIGKIHTASPADKEFEEAVKQTDLLINCSPIGMSPEIDNSPVSAHLLNDKMTVFDVVYNPLKTKLLQEAESAGARIISGVEMFVNQAVAQFEMFTGEKAPVELMRSIVLDALQK
jgi:shikimate dehydrogenase